MIELRDIRKNYQVGDVDLPVLKGITLDVAAGAYVALMGSSGSGKTTLMNLLGSLDTPTSGTYHLAGTDVSALSGVELAEFRNRQIGFVFQNFNLLARTTVLDNVLLPTLYATDGQSPRERADYARYLLNAVGLSGRLDHTPNQLSGGERQRVAIARALINRPQLLLADEPTGNLDSKTEREILDVFRRLNQEHHITLVVVTHDAEVARQADRIIHMKDGLIEGDVTQPIVAVSSATNEPARTVERHMVRVRPRSLAATANAISVATLALKRNTLRTVLTMLGVIIGVASVITVMELSSGASHAIKDTVASMGASTLTVSASKGADPQSARQSVELTPDDVHAIAAGCPSVQVAAPMMYSRLQLVRGNQRWIPSHSLGTSSEYLKARNWDDLELGRAFSRYEIDDAAKVCVIGKTVADNLFGEEYPIGEEVRANGVLLRVIGVLSAKGADVIGTDQDDIVIAPWTTIKFRVNNTISPPQPVSTFADQMPEMQLASRRATTRNEFIHQVFVQAFSPELVPDARDQIINVLKRRHAVDSKHAFRISDMTEVSNVMDQVVNGLSALGLVIAGVSLLVGGVGIMNIMLVSVTERTREIGLRMAVGANARTILRQFLIESAVLCLLGGGIGIVIGHLGSMAVGAVMGWPNVMSVAAPVVAVGVALTVGVVFGYYPALKASKLNPIDALRFE